MLLNGDKEPIENILIFDEAQRCGDREKFSRWVKKQKMNNLDYSEPEYFIECMNKKSDADVLICLVGLGQDIYDGEICINE